MPSYLIPLAIVFIVIFALPRHWLKTARFRPFAVVTLMGTTGIFLFHYLSWRYTSTLPGFASFSLYPGQFLFSWTLAVIETLIWIDTFIFFITLSRKRDNHKKADEHEARLRSLDPNSLPTVDVYIATYNEDKDVLEKTIIGAQSLDWPKEKLCIYVLDDGKRDWLKDYCETYNVNYLTREGNEDAKAGNINAAIKRTSGDYFMVLDADFVPQTNFLYRSMGFFEDEKVGIVQIPHNFYNGDPMQTNLGLRKIMPDDQRLFFNTIMACRDAWNVAFCCGSNSITRRSAIETVGGKLPSGSITEDMLLTLALLRKGFVTRYLNERLAIGLAPESLSALYIQRARWARGSIQILFHPLGPLGKNLTLTQRLMFLPLHWFVQPLTLLMTLSMPAICLWTGWSPLLGASVQDIFFFQFPAVVAILGTLRLLSPDGFFLIMSMVHGVLQIPRILPTVITTLIKPHGHAFKVTPKGSAAGGASDKAMIFLPLILIIMTGLGLLVNSNINTQIIEDKATIPLLALWATFSMIILSITQAVAITRNVKSKAERFEVNEPSHYSNRDGKTIPIIIEKLSAAGAQIKTTLPNDSFNSVRWMKIHIPNVGDFSAFVKRRNAEQATIEFFFEDENQRRRLIQRLFTTNMDNSTHTRSSLLVTGALLWSIVVKPKEWPRAERSTPTPPEWLIKQMEK